MNNSLKASQINPIEAGENGGICTRRWNLMTNPHESGDKSSWSLRGSYLFLGNKLFFLNLSKILFQFSFFFKSVKGERFSQAPGVLI